MHARKFLLWLGVATGALVLLGGILWISILYVDYRVPVKLRIGPDMFSSDQFVSAKGTWVIDNDQQAFPLQTTHIFCDRARGLCVDATAIVMGGKMLDVSLDIHDVLVWNRFQVIYTNDNPLCSRYVYTIDLVSKRASAIRSMNPKAPKDACAYAENKDLQLRLADGFRVTLGEERKAEPFPIRLVRAMFGEN